MKIRKGLALVLALVMTLLLLPASALAAEVPWLNIKDTSKNYAAYTQQFGCVKALDDESESTQMLDYTVPENGVTVLLFFRANGVCMNSNKIMDEIGQTGWAKNEKVNIVAVETAGADRSTVQSYIDEHDAAGVLDKVYYNSGSVAFWYAKLIQNNGDMTDVTNIGGVSLSFGYAIVITQGNGGNYIRYSLPNLESAEELTAFVGEFVDISGDEGDIEDYTALYTTTIRDPQWDHAPVAEELELLNEYRVSKGLSEVAFDATAQQAAMRRAAEIAVYYSHTLPDHTQSTQYAENIAAGYRTAAEAMNGWINSEGHRMNIETANFRSVGLGCFTAGDGTMYWVQLFSDAAPTGGSVGMSGPYECEVTVAKKYLDLSVSPSSVNLEVGKTEAVTLKNTNQGFPSGVSNIYATSWASQDPSVATAEEGTGGVVTVTAVGAGTTTVRVGLEPAVSGIEPIVVDIPVTVTAAATEKKALTKSMFTVDTADETYTGTAITKSVSGKDGSAGLAEGTDYTVTYQNNTDVGTATLTITGVGNYTGTLEYTFQIAKRKVTLAQSMFTVDTSDETYTGQAITKSISGQDDNAALTQGTDYTVVYKNNTNAGTATITITGKGDYIGTLTYTFTIKPRITKTVELKKYDYDNARITNYEYDFWTPVGEDEHGLIHTRKDGKCGLFDSKTNKEILPCKYDWIDDFDDVGVALVYVGDWETRKYGFIDTTGKEIIPCIYDRAYSFSEGLATVRQNDKYGFIDRTGKLVIPCKYDTARYFWGGQCIVGLETEEENGDTTFLYGIIDANGDEVVPCQYRYMRYCTDGYVGEGSSDEPLIFVCAEGDGPNDWDAKWAILNPETRETVPFNYEIREDVIGAERYPSVGFHEGLARVSTNDRKYGFINAAGEEVIPCRYDYVSNFSEGLAAAQPEEDGMRGYIDKTGEVVIPCAYYSADDFSEGLAAVRLEKDGMYGYIDKTGVTVIPCQYSEAYSFSGGTAQVRKDGESYYIDKTGTRIPDEDEVYMTVADDGMQLVSRNDKVGLVDAAGEEVIPCQYDAVYSWNDGAALVKLDDKVMFVDKNGGELKTNISIPTPYDLAEANYASETANWNWVGGFIYDHREWIDEYSYHPYEGICTFTVKTTTEGGSGGGSSSGGSSSGGGSGGSSEPATKPDEPQEPTEITKPASEVYTDVAKDSWYEDGVTFVTEKGLFNGVAQGVFAPDTNMTRAMLMTVLARLDGQDTDSGETWYAQGMRWAMEEGISDGTMPERNVTREQLVTMLYRYAKAAQTQETLEDFVDGDSVSAWAKEAMTWAVVNGIVTGKDGKRLDPQGTATRAEVATILQRFMENQ